MIDVNDFDFQVAYPEHLCAALTALKVNGLKGEDIVVATNRSISTSGSSTHSVWGYFQETCMLAQPYLVSFIILVVCWIYVTLRARASNSRRA